MLAALLIMWFKPTWTWVDPIAALLVAVYIALMAVQLLSHSTAGLMDRQDAADDSCCAISSTRTRPGRHASRTSAATTSCATATADGITGSTST